MKSLVIYSSQYGNSKKVAEAIAKSISAKLMMVDEVNISDLEGVGRLIVGSPTQGGRPTKDLQLFLDSIPNQYLKGMTTAAFDTRFREEKLKGFVKWLVKTIGYAAPKILKTLEKKGGKVVDGAKGFYVKDKEGPLEEGELKRAEEWAKNID